MIRAWAERFSYTFLLKSDKVRFMTLMTLCGGTCLCYLILEKEGSVEFLRNIRVLMRNNTQLTPWINATPSILSSLVVYAGKVLQEFHEEFSYSF